MQCNKLKILSRNQSEKVWENIIHHVTYWFHHFWPRKIGSMFMMLVDEWRLGLNGLRMCLHSWWVKQRDALRELHLWWSWLNLSAYDWNIVACRLNCPKDICAWREQQAAAFATPSDFIAYIQFQTTATEKRLDSGQHHRGSQAISDKMAVSENPHTNNSGLWQAAQRKQLPTPGIPLGCQGGSGENPVSLLILQAGKGEEIYAGIQGEKKIVSVLFSQLVWVHHVLRRNLRALGEVLLQDRKCQHVVICVSYFPALSSKYSEFLLGYIKDVKDTSQIWAQVTLFG